jgi:AbiJ N-terminal domain 4
MTRFSDRHGYQMGDPEITVREDAPAEFRGVLVDIAYEAGFDPHNLRSLVCRVLRVRADPSNWSAFPNVDGEIRGHLDACAWYEVYDVAEEVASSLARVAQFPFGSSGGGAMAFEAELNDYFRKRGIGWQMTVGQLKVRGSSDFELTLADARKRLAETQRPTAAREVEQALQDLSRRPVADRTGAIQHILAALECVARDVSGEATATLGAILNRHRGLFPPPLNVAIEKIWGFASERGRHLREGGDPGPDETVLVVQVSAAAITYLGSKSWTAGDGA